jgi:hypothetical protein
MMQAEQIIVVVAGGRRYAVPRHTVRGLQRVAGARKLPGLADLLGGATADEEQFALIVDTEREIAFRVRHADLRRDLPQLELPDWIARLAHPAVCGCILDEAELMPLVDLVQLARQIGHDAT